jgi:hypothetical protein
MELSNHTYGNTSASVKTMNINKDSIKELGVNCQYPLSGETFEQKQNFREVDLGKVAEVLQKGYTMSGKVIRPALVKVFEK